MPRFGTGMALHCASTVMCMHADLSSVSFEDIKIVFFETTSHGKISSEQLFRYLHEQHIEQCTSRGGPCSHGPSFNAFLEHFRDESIKPDEWYGAQGGWEWNQHDDETVRTI